MLHPTKHQNINLEPAFVLHSRPYRETSTLLTFFTQNFGKVAAIARGVRRARSRTAGLLLPFVPLTVALRGKGELLNLQSVEAFGVTTDIAMIDEVDQVAKANSGDIRSKCKRYRSFYGLTIRMVFYGLYMNELLISLLEYHDPHSNLYCYYQAALYELEKSRNDTLVHRATLCWFERKLLKEIGYGLQLNKTATGESIVADESYNFQAGIGLTKVNSVNNHVYQGYSPHPQYYEGQMTQTLTLKGKVLLALHDEQLKPLHNEENLAALNQILKQVFYHVLGNKFTRCCEILELNNP